MALPRSNVTVLWPMLALLLGSWLVELVGLYFLQRSCKENHTDPSWATAAELPGSYSCNKIYRFLWWTVIFEFPIAVGLLSSLMRRDAAGAIRRFRFAWLALIAVNIVLHMLAANKALNITDTWPTSQGLTDTERLRAIVTTVGFCAGAAGNILLLFLLGDDGYSNAAAEAEAPLLPDSPRRGAATL